MYFIYISFFKLQSTNQLSKERLFISKKKGGCGFGPAIRKKLSIYNILLDGNQITIECKKKRKKAFRMHHRFLRFKYERQVTTCTVNITNYGSFMYSKYYSLGLHLLNSVF